MLYVINLMCISQLQDVHVLQYFNVQIGFKSMKRIKKDKKIYFFISVKISLKRTDLFIELNLEYCVFLCFCVEHTVHSTLGTSKAFQWNRDFVQGCSLH